MDRENSSAENAAETAVPPPHESVWSVGKLIQLIDEAIDAAGAQLARSAGLFADSPSPFDEDERPSRQQRSSSALLQLEELDRDGGISPP